VNFKSKSPEIYVNLARRTSSAGVLNAVVRIQHLVLAVSAVWLVATFAILFNAAEGKWAEFFFSYTFVALIPVILVNAICCIIKR
jgi:hypothetical protein